MKIISGFFWIAILSLIGFIAIQNYGQRVDINFFNYHYEQVELLLVIAASFIVGLFIGALSLMFKYIQAKVESRKYRKENKDLLDELASFRNLSIDNELKTK